MRGFLGSGMGNIKTRKSKWISYPANEFSWLTMISPTSLKQRYLLTLGEKEPYLVFPLLPLFPPSVSVFSADTRIWLAILFCTKISSPFSFGDRRANQSCWKKCNSKINGIDRKRWSQCYIISFVLVLFFFFCCTCGMWKFFGQESNLHCSSDPSHCSDNPRSLTHCTTREFLFWPCS